MGWPDNRIQDIHGPIGCEPELGYSLSHSARPKVAPLQGTPGYEPLSEVRIGLFGEDREVWEWIVE